MISQEQAIEYLQESGWLPEHDKALTENAVPVEKTTKMIKFILNGCDIQFIAEAPADITLEQLLRQCDKIKPHWCACGIKSYDFDYDFLSELRIDYDSIIKLDPTVSCDIEGEEEDNV